jgi:rare lipoprotein A (peptidoglycan hydrolase)
MGMSAISGLHDQRPLVIHARNRRFKPLFLQVAIATQILVLTFAPIKVANARAKEESTSKPVPSTLQHASPSRPKVHQVALAHGKKDGRKGLSGKASFYANRFHGRKTASGHPYFKDAMTAAHRSLPLGTWVKVTNDHDGSNVIVQITDRGPYARNRVIDLSRAAAMELGMLKVGTVPVTLEVVQEFRQASASIDEWADIRIASGY